MPKFIIKKVIRRKSHRQRVVAENVPQVRKTEVERVMPDMTENTDDVVENNKNENTESNMEISDKIAIAQSILGDGAEKKNIKRIKRNKGLIEKKTLSSKIILTEDNKQLLND